MQRQRTVLRIPVNCFESVRETVPGYVVSALAFSRASYGQILGYKLVVQPHLRLLIV